MYMQYRELKLIQLSGRPDEDNEAILRGDYLNKSPQKDEEGHETPFKMPTRDEMIKQFIFPNWQAGDILVIAEQPLKHPKVQGDTLIEMTREEVCASGDLSVLIEGEVWEDGKIVIKPKPEGLKIVWEYPNWVEKASDTEINLKAVREQYNEFEPMNNPLTFIELEEQGLKQEYITMMRELQSLIVQLETQIEKIRESEDRSLFSEVTIDIPQPTEALIKFKNKFNLI